MYKILLPIFLILISLGCKKNLESGEGGNLSFYSDTIIDGKHTIHFDTLFTSIGSITKELRVLNNYNYDIYTDIYIKGSSSGNFRMNVDGETVKNSIQNVKIPANDSIFIFVEVTVDPNENQLPFILNDSIEFITGEITQIVKLIAWGQNAHFYTPNTIYNIYSGNDTIAIPCHKIESNTVWNDDLPHVIYGYVLVEGMLDIEQNTKIHLHKNSSILVLGTLNINGFQGNEVVIQGDRLDSWYQDKAGQWDRIWFMPGSHDNKINYAVIKNGNIGIHADTVNPYYGGAPNVEINNTIIHNMSYAGILGQGTYLKANNSIITNCGQYMVMCNLGGEYVFKHCTFANFWEYGRTTPSILLNNYYEDANGVIRIRDLTNTYFGNCIIDGLKTTEISLDQNQLGDFNYTFDHCVVKTDQDINTNHYINSIKLDINDNAGFIDQENNLQLEDNSPAINSGDINITNSEYILYQDIEGTSRTLSPTPDIGALEKP